MIPPSARQPDRSEIEQTRPAALPELELEQRESPPRSSRWVNASGEPHARSDLLRDAVARKAWVVRVDVTLARSYENDDYLIWCAADGPGGIELYHPEMCSDLAHSSPELRAYFDALQAGTAVTVLCHHDLHELYGLLDVYLERTGKERIAFYRERRTPLAFEDVLDLLFHLCHREPRRAGRALRAAGVPVARDEFRAVRDGARSLRERCAEGRDLTGVLAALEREIGELACLDLVGDFPH